MNYEINYNYEYLPKTENYNSSNPIFPLDNIDINNNNNNYYDNKISFYLEPYNNYNYLYYKGDNLNNNSIENNFYKKNNSPIIKRNIIKEEIKNIDSNDEYYKDYYFIPNQLNYDTSKNEKHNKIIKNIEINNNNCNSLYDLIFPQKQSKTNIKILNYNIKNNDYCNISPSKNLIDSNCLKDNSINRNSPEKINQNISPLKNNLYYNLGNNNYTLERNHSKDKYKRIKIKKQIINRVTDKLYNNIKIINNENKDNKKFLNNIPEEYKKNHINLIPIPSNLKKFNNNTSDKNKKKILPISNNFKRNRDENTSLKKNITNIDINTDFDKENKESIHHKKNYSSILGNSIINTDNNNANAGSLNINKINNIKENDKPTELYNYLNKNTSDNNIFNGRKKRSTSKKKVKIQIFNSNSNNINNVYDLNTNGLPKNFKIFWGGKSQAGKDSSGNIKVNQDSFKVCENINNIKNFNIFILCDGHGKDGHHVSKFVTDFIISSISNHPLLISIKDLYQIYRILTEFNYKIIKEIFSETDNYLYNQQNFDTYVSGTTCVLILQIGNKIICANSGDSRAILIYSTNYNNYKNSKEINNTKIVPLSLDSKPDLPSEKERIINSGGEVHKGKNRKGKLVGPMRVFAKGKNFPGLAMSRSLGDFKSKDYGVICEPSFIEYNLDQFCKYIVVCSDGVWDFIDNEKVMKIGNKHYLNNNPDGFCQEILGYASYWWEKEDIVIDDITALIVFFKF